MMMYNTSRVTFKDYNGIHKRTDDLYITHNFFVIKHRKKPSRFLSILCLTESKQKNLLFLQYFAVFCFLIFGEY